MNMPAPKARAEARCGQQRRSIDRKLPAHLPRENAGPPPRDDRRCTTTRPAALAAAPPAAAGCARSAQDVSEQLEYVPARFKVIRHVRPKLACVSCQAIFQAAAPSRPIARGVAGPGLLAHVLVVQVLRPHPAVPAERASTPATASCIDPLDRWPAGSTRAHALLDPLVAALGRYALAGVKVHADDTPVPVLDPGRGRTKTGRLWVYVRDDRPAGSTEPPAAWFRYSPDRKGEHPQEHLKRLPRHPAGRRLRRLRQDLCERTRSTRQRAGRTRDDRSGICTRARAASPGSVAEQALQRIAALYAIEAEIRGQPPDVAAPRATGPRRAAAGRPARLAHQHARHACRRSRSWPRRSATRSRAGRR